MAYRFNGTSDFLQFALGPFNGYTMDAVTVAALLKRNTVGGGTHSVASFISTAPAITWRTAFASTNLYQYRTLIDGTCSGPVAASSTSVWYLVVITRAAGASGITPRFHIWNGATWSHDPADFSTSAQAISATDIFRVGDNASLGGRLPADLVCLGIKKANSTDLQVEALSPTNFTAWTAFGFDWLTGFESASSPVINRTAPGNGDETSRSGTTLVADPPGWNWASMTTTSQFETLILTGYKNRDRGLMQGANYRLRQAYLAGMTDPTAHTYAKSNARQVKALNDNARMTDFDAITAP